jgi:hypothetical protein
LTEAERTRKLRQLAEDLAAWERAQPDDPVTHLQRSLDGQVRGMQVTARWLRALPRVLAQADWPDRATARRWRRIQRRDRIRRAFARLTVCPLLGHDWAAYGDDDAFCDRCMAHESIDYLAGRPNATSKRR